MKSGCSFVTGLRERERTANHDRNSCFPCSTGRREFDEAQLRNLVRTMTPRSRFFQVLREELKRIGRWKYLPRGKPGEPLKQGVPKTYRQVWL